MCFLSGPQMLRGLSFDTIAQKMFVALLMSKPSKNSVSLTILLSCNSKELIFDFYRNRKKNKCWLAAYSLDLFTWQYVGGDASSVIDHNFAGNAGCGIRRLGCR